MTQGATWTGLPRWAARRVAGTGPVVTCAIDHIPPPLLQQMKPNGIMVIPIGPPGAQYALKVTKQQGADGSISIARSDIYHGGRVSFVPFTRLEGDLIKGTPRTSDWRF